MKKSILLLLFCFAAAITYAKKYRIKVSNYQFSKSTINAKVGDTIIWKWVEGSHTTTSLAIPAGAKPWDAPMNSTHKTFMYILKKKGTYNYQCTPHSTFMKGKIIVSANLNDGFDDFDISSDNSIAVLTWKTAPGNTIQNFSVQKSYDQNKFAEIKFLQANASNTYIFKDIADTHRFVYYQIKLTDKSGAIQLSDIKIFDRGANNSTPLIISLSPNPVSNQGHLMMQFNAGTEGKMLVQLFSQSGKLVKQTEMSAEKGVNNGHFHAGEQAPGSYFLVCTLNGKVEKHTVIFK